MSKSAKTKANTKANETTNAAASNSNSSGNPKNSVKYDDAINQITYSRVTTPEKATVFSSKQEIKDRKNEYAHGPDTNYLRAVELSLIQRSRQNLTKVKASNAQKDEMRNNNIAYINGFVDERRDFLKDNKARGLYGTEHDVAQVPVEIHYSRQNLNRVDGKSKKDGKKGGKKRTRKNRTQRKH